MNAENIDAEIESLGRGSFIFTYVPNVRAKGASPWFKNTPWPIRASWRDSNGVWEFRSERAPDGDRTFRIRSKIDAFAGRIENPEYAWMDVCVSTDPTALEIRTDPFWWYPAYWWEGSWAVIVSDSVKNVTGFMEGLGVRPSLDENAAFASVICNFTPTGADLIRGIEHFQNGATTRISPKNGTGATVDSQRWAQYAFGTSPDPESSYREYAETFDRVMSEFLEYAKRTGPLGLMFTGGLDSSVLLRWFSERGGCDNVIAVTSSIGTYAYHDDMNAREIAGDLKVRHVVTRNAESGLGDLPATIASIEDTSDMFGYGIVLDSIFRELPGVSDFLTGSGTDSAIASTPPILSAIWYRLHRPESPNKTFNSSRIFESVATTGIPAHEFLSQPVHNVRSAIRNLSVESVAAMNFTKLRAADFLGGTWYDAQSCAPYRDRYWLRDSELRFHDLYSLMDLDGVAGRFSWLYRKHSAFRKTSTHSPFANARLRKIAFECPVRGKFDPASYPTTVRDNQLFYKRALERYVPERIRNRSKTFWSVPDPHYWLTHPDWQDVLEKIITRFRSRAIVAEPYMEKLLAIWRMTRANREGWARANRETKRTIALSLSPLWRMLVLEIYLRQFTEKDSLPGDGRRFRLESYQ